MTWRSANNIKYLRRGCEISPCWYNFARVNSAVRISPAMAARLTEILWDIGDIVKLIEEWEAADGVVG